MDFGVLLDFGDLLDFAVAVTLSFFNGSGFEYWIIFEILLDFGDLLDFEDFGLLLVFGD